MIIRTVLNLNKQDFIEEWNKKYPYDRWWRKKYNVPFGSKLHKEACFIDMAIEFEEDMMFLKLNRKKKYVEVDDDEYDEQEQQVDKLIAENVYIPTKGEKTVVKMSPKEIDKEFDELDLSQFNDKNPE